jgi:hypothetical protein
MVWLQNLYRHSDGFCILSNMYIGIEGALIYLVRPAELGNVQYSLNRILS